MDIFEQLRPALTDVAVILVTAAVAWLGQRLHAWTGVEIEASRREALQSALANGARLAIDHGIDVAVRYVQDSVPDALAHFAADDPERIEELLAPHISRAKAAA